MPTTDLSSILDSLTPAVLLIDHNRKIILANRTATRLFGSASPDQKINEHGLEGADFVRIVRHPDCIKAIDKVLAGQKKRHIVISLHNPVAVTYRVNIFNIEGRGDEAGASGRARAVVSFDDISHILDAEKMRSDFVANVSHELRSPLTTLTGFIETLKGTAKDDEQARSRFLDIMEREAQRMKRLISDLLSLSKVESDEYVRPTDKVDVLSVIEQVIDNLGTQAKGRKIVFTKPFENPKPVPGDEDQLTQVFQNLIENSLKYSEPEGKVTINIKELKSSFGIVGQVLSVVIKDKGPGIAAEHIPRLTERFYRIDRGRSRAMGGTGLGLAIVKHILNRHRGRLEIRSQTDIGSTFTVLLSQRF